MTTYVLFNKGEVVGVTNESPYTGTPELKKFPGVEYDVAKSSWEFQTFNEVADVAIKITLLVGELYLPYDRGDSVSPRFGVMKAPQIGDEVSRGFNGDYYPCGVITKITRTFRITTSTGHKFSRRGQSSSWREIGRHTSMVAGHIDERNPHF